MILIWILNLTDSNKAILPFLGVKFFGKSFFIFCFQIFYEFLVCLLERAYNSLLHSGLSLTICIYCEYWCLALFITLACFWVSCFSYASYLFLDYLILLVFSPLLHFPLSVCLEYVYPSSILLWSPLIFYYACSS